MKKPYSSILQKFWLAPKALIFLVVLIVLGGAWKIAITLAAQPHHPGSVVVCLPGEGYQPRG